MGGCTSKKKSPFTIDNNTDFKEFFVMIKNFQIINSPAVKFIC